MDYQILVSKLEYYGIRGIARGWVVSYLTNRKQIVFVNGSISDQLNVPCGVPQRSVLGPLLFLLYINDFHDSSKLFDFHLFANDASLFYENRNLIALATNVNIELQKVHTWLCANRVSLHVDKSKYVIFHPVQKKISLNDVRLMMNDKILKNDSFIKYLGVYIDSHLNWKIHIDYVSKKIKRSIGLLSELRYFVSRKVPNNLYYALLYPFFIYGLVTWGNTYETTYYPSFVHFTCVYICCIMTFSKFDDHSSPLFKSLRIVKLFDLVSIQTAISS